MTLVKKLCQLHDFMTSMAAALAGVGLIFIVSAYVYEVVTRYVFDSPTAWVSDFVSYALGVTVFLALPKVTRDKGHVAVTVLVDALPSRMADGIYLVLSSLGFASLAFASWISLQENIRQYQKGIETLAIVAIPQWWVSGFITFGLLLSSLYVLRYASPSHRVSTHATSPVAEP
jgi:TRAP-type C4-dicarboxylate transport system permease small subunit